MFQNSQVASTKLLEAELQETKQKLVEQKQITSELNAAKKQAQQIQIQFNSLHAEHESDKKAAEQMIESYNDKCKNFEQKLLEAQKTIADLESNLILVRQDNEKSLNEIQGI